MAALVLPRSTATSHQLTAAPTGLPRGAPVAPLLGGRDREQRRRGPRGYCHLRGLGRRLGCG